ncbi:MAG: hypothetical protein PVH88_27685 [Ignavibacteria bacterium]
MSIKSSFHILRLTLKDKETSSDNENTQPGVKEIEMKERPRICCLDILKNDNDILIQSGFNIYPGSLGNKIKVPNERRNDYHQVKLDYDIPLNLHEYDIFIIDLHNSTTIDYVSEDHKITNHTGKSALTLLCSYPETIFDPRPLSSYFLGKKIEQLGNRKHIIICFTTPNYDVEYQTAKITETYSERMPNQTHNIYEFLGYAPLSQQKHGKEFKVDDIRSDLKNLLQLYIPESFYNQTFHHPSTWDGKKYISDPDYIPLIKNLNDDIVSICDAKRNSLVFYFPQLKNKGKFLNDLLTKIAPELIPELFPFSNKFVWKENEEYYLPNHKKLVEEKKGVEFEYKEKLKLKDDEISANNKRFSFLHDIITETGDKLVDSLIKYLKWLGFKHVTKVDDNKKNSILLEEDIQVELENGLLVIECKGIGGTSTDSDCSQISKIKHRRCKERNSFDVYALYIVNHQRYLPPSNRINPPFSENQKQDAVNDERGLLTTWQLFNAYYAIEDEILDRNTVRKNLLQYGYIDLRPVDLKLIDEPKEIFKDGYVCIVNIKDTELKISDEILVENEGKFKKAIIEEIQINDNPIEQVASGEIGLYLSVPIKKKSILWKR